MLMIIRWEFSSLDHSEEHHQTTPNEHFHYFLIAHVHRSYMHAKEQTKDMPSVGDYHAIFLQLSNY